MDDNILEIPRECWNVMMSIEEGGTELIANRMGVVAGEERVTWQRIYDENGEERVWNSKS